MSIKNIHKLLNQDKLNKSDLIKIAKLSKINITGTKDIILKQILIKYKIKKENIYSYSNLNNMKSILKSKGINPIGNKRMIFNQFLNLQHIGGKRKNKNDFKYLIVSHAEQGKREYMEDYRFIFQNNSIIFNGIFDGHGGKECAAYLKLHLFKNFKEIIKNYHKINNSLKRVFFQTNRDWLRTGKNSGSTCNLVIINKDTKSFFVANTGDSRAILCMNDGNTIALSKDHKTSNPKEKLRIEKSGGFVKGGRVNGILAMSRSFGDKDISEYLTSNPDIIKGNLTKNAFFILQASDGLFDVMSNKQIFTYVKFLISKKTPLTNIPKLLVNHAINIGSYDNVSAIITFIS